MNKGLKLTDGQRNCLREAKAAGEQGLKPAYYTAIPGLVRREFLVSKTGAPQLIFVITEKGLQALECAAENVS